MRRDGEAVVENEDGMIKRYVDGHELFLVEGQEIHFLQPFQSNTDPSISKGEDAGKPEIRRAGPWYIATIRNCERVGYSNLIEHDKGRFIWESVDNNFVQPHALPFPAPPPTATAADCLHEFVQSAIQRTAGGSVRLRGDWIMPTDRYFENYCHWHMQTLIGIGLTKRYEGFRDANLLFPRLKPWQRESLRLMGISRERYAEVPLNMGCRVDRMIYPSPSWAFYGDVFNVPTSAHSIFQTIKENSGYAEATDRRVLYISRVGAEHRPMANETELIDYMRKIGVEVIAPETMTYEQQIRMFSSAAMVIGASGAAFTNLGFAPKDCVVIELQNEIFERNNGWLWFCSAMGLRIHHFFEKAPDVTTLPDNEGARQSLDWNISVDEFAAYFEALISEYEQRHLLTT